MQQQSHRRIAVSVRQVNAANQVAGEGRNRVKDFALFGLVSLPFLCCVNRECECVNPFLLRPVTHLLSPSIDLLLI